MCRVLFQISLTDTQPGFKLFRREVLDVELPKIVVKKWAFDIEILVNANSDGYKIVEAPIDMSFSRQDGGRIGFKTAKGIFQDTLGVFYRIKGQRELRQGEEPENRDQMMEHSGASLILGQHPQKNIVHLIQGPRHLLLLLEPPVRYPNSKGIPFINRRRLARIVRSRCSRSIALGLVLPSIRSV